MHYRWHSESEYLVSNFKLNPESLALPVPSTSGYFKLLDSKSESETIIQAASSSASHPGTVVTITTTGTTPGTTAICTTGSTNLINLNNFESRR